MQAGLRIGQALQGFGEVPDFEEGHNGENSPLRPHPKYSFPEIRAHLVCSERRWTALLLLELALPVLRRRALPNGRLDAPILIGYLSVCT